MDFDIQIVHGVEEVGQAAWEKLGGGQPFASYRWYRFGEVVMDDCMPVYIILSQKGGPIARATFWVIRNEPLPISWRPVRAVLQAVLRRWPMFACRSPLSNSSGLILPEPPLRGPVLEAIKQTAMEEAKKYKSSFLVFDFMEEEQTRWNEWTKLFVPYMITDPGTRMEIKWSNFDQYLGHLSQKARKHYRQYIREAEEVGIRITRHDHVPDIESALALVQDVEKRHGSTPSPWTRRMLKNAGLVGATWLTANVNDRLVGCELILADYDTQMVTALGLDRDFRHAYFLLGYADIQYAIEKRMHTLRWGSGAYEAKRQAGFELEKNNNIVFCGIHPLFSQVTCLMGLGKKR
jgi:predicted N-acyltransferase